MDQSQEESKLNDKVKLVIKNNEEQEIKQSVTIEKVNTIKSKTKKSKAGKSKKAGDKKTSLLLEIDQDKSKTGKRLRQIQS
jgi:hypothetical protein